MTDSYYHAHAAKVPAAPPLAGTVETETAIVGGGLAGLATALSLTERGRPAVLLEAKAVGAGASGRNGGMVSAGFAASHTPARARGRAGRRQVPHRASAARRWR